MGGTIQVESEYGIGSTFTITLPQKIVSPEPLGKYETKFEKNMLKARPCDEGFRAPDAHILVVDDTRMNLNVITGLLKNTKVKIDTVFRGADAVKLADEYVYDLILMDQRMPGMDGTEALHCIRQQKNGLNRETPVICLTADAISGAKERSLSAGFTDYLTKPIDSQALTKMLIRYLSPDKVEKDPEKCDLTALNEEKAISHKFDFLTDLGIDPETGLRYCQGDEVLYQSVLTDFLQAARQKMHDLCLYYCSGDWKNYGIQIHSLKSSSKMIGANELSEMAAMLEEASGHEDMQTLRLVHPKMMETYRVLAEVLAVRMGIDAHDEDGAEVLEFFPE